jgi:hypothetical protein
MKKLFLILLIMMFTVLPVFASQKETYPAITKTLEIGDCVEFNIGKGFNKYRDIIIFSGQSWGTFIFNYPVIYRTNYYWIPENQKEFKILVGDGLYYLKIKIIKKYMLLPVKIIVQYQVVKR